MDIKTADYLKELEKIVPQRNLHQIIEARASNVIASAIHLLQLIEENFTPEQTDELHRRLLGSIKNQDPNKFIRKIKEYKETANKAGRKKDGSKI